jgi:nitroimidazol reductase NimA-like FMN-containing flavoprotein (pyridoxamine 5'-phosphate oxidase superfamily)
MLAAIGRADPIAVCVTLVDGLVLARSVYSHSLNYRSVVVYGHGEEVAERDEKMEVLRRLVEHVAPGRSQEARMPNEAEIRSTRVVRVRIEEASAKVRSGPPKDDDADLDLPVWAGVLPFVPSWGPPVPDDLLLPGVPLSPSLSPEGPFAGARP